MSEHTAPVLAAINHLLRQNPAVCAELSGFNGLVAAVRSVDLTVCGRFDQYGLLQAADRHPDTVLVLHRGTLPKILQGSLPDLSDFALEGDTELGMHLIRRFIRLRYRPYEDLARILGADTLAKLAGRAAQLRDLFALLVPLLQAAAPEQDVQAENRRLQAELQQLKQELSHLRRRQP